MITIRLNSKRSSGGDTREVDKALRKLKKAMMPAMRDIKDRQYFEKPGDKKRKKSIRARVRARKEEKALNQNQNQGQM